jgi:hypothetical protein
LRVVEGFAEPSRSAERARECARSEGFLDSLEPALGRRAIRLRLVVTEIEGRDALRLDPSIQAPSATRQAVDGCLLRLSQQLAMVPDEVLIEARRR